MAATAFECDSVAASPDGPDRQPRVEDDVDETLRTLATIIAVPRRNTRRIAGRRSRVLPRRRPLPRRLDARLPDDGDVGGLPPLRRPSRGPVRPGDRGEAGSGRAPQGGAGRPRPEAAVDERAGRLSVGG